MRRAPFGMPRLSWEWGDGKRARARAQSLARTPGEAFSTSGRSPGSRIFLLPDLPTRATLLDLLPCSGSSGFVPGYSGGGRAGFTPASLKTREPPLSRRLRHHRVVWFFKEALHG